MMPREAKEGCYTMSDVLTEQDNFRLRSALYDAANQVNAAKLPGVATAIRKNADEYHRRLHIAIERLKSAPPSDDKAAT